MLDSASPDTTPAVLQQRISELEQALEAQRQENDYARFFALSLDLACIASFDGYFKDVNPSFAEALGYSVDTILETPFFDLIHPDDIAPTNAALGELGEGHQLITFENRYRKRDGSYIWLSWKANPIPTERLVYAIARDVTEQKKMFAAMETTKRELQWQADMLRRAENLAHVGHWRINLKDQSLFWSDEIYHIHGRDPKTFVPMLADGIKAYHPDDQDHVARVVQEAIEQAKDFAFQLRIVRPTGEIRHVASRGQCQVGVDGTVTSVFGVFHDVTDLKRAEDALGESEMRFRLAADGASAGIWDWLDVNSDAEWWSPKFYELLGYEEGEIAPTLANFAAMLHPDDQASTFALVEEHFKGNARFVTEYRLRTKQGTYKWFLGSGKASFTESGKPVRMIGSIIDIDALKNAERVLAEHMETLKHQNAELEQFAYVASHDLQEPLRTITSFVGLLERQLEDVLDADSKEFMAFISDAARRMKTLISDLLEYSRIGRWEVNLAPTDLNALASTIIQVLSVPIEEKGATVFVEPLPVLTCDAAKVGLLFQNLISNGLKYNKSEAPTVHISAKRKGKMWEFAIQDNGIGIDPKFHDRIFQIFKRLHGRTAYQGTGIGLALCQKVVVGHGGQIWVDSTPRQGATFYFTLPHQMKA